MIEDEIIGVFCLVIGNFKLFPSTKISFEFRDRVNFVNKSNQFFVFPDNFRLE